ncbi:MAG: alpha/beta hydrolase [bacterium]|nr:alpha/beta hydrolase [bacterium]
MSLKEDSVKVQGRLTHFWETGTQHRQSILLLHGGLGDAWLNWSAAMPLLADGFHVIAPDLPGYGQSDSLPGLSVQKLLDWTKGFLEARQLEQTVVIGHSFGALLARLFTAQNPKLVPALVLVSGGGIPDIPRLSRFVGGLPVLGNRIFTRISQAASAKHGLETVVHTKNILTDAFVNRVRTSVKAQAALRRALSITAIPDNWTPRVPVLMLWGEHDTVVPLSVGERIQQNIPGAKLNVIADCGHLPHIEASEVFDFQVTNFLNELNKARRPDR